MIDATQIPGVSKLLRDISGIEETLLKTHFFKQSICDSKKAAWLKKTKPHERDPLVPTCNLVLQGGGMLGAAHVGFIYGLEKAGVRFAGVAGASAGSIVGMALVCIRGEKFWNPTADKLFEYISTVRTDSFIDGPTKIRRLIKRLLRGKKPVALHNISGIRASYRRLLRTRGLNPGDAFEEWLEQILNNHKVASILELNQILDNIRYDIDELPFKSPALPGASSKNRSKQAPQSPEDLAKKPVLKLMAASLPVGMKFEFPGDLDLLADRYKNENPALLVRASMAVPVFFEPVAFDVNPEKWKSAVEQKMTHLAVQSAIKETAALKSVYMVDGGAFSNLPLDAFMNVNTLPTVAVTLIENPPAEQSIKAQTLKGLVKDGASLLSAIKAQRDRDAYDSIVRNGQEDMVRLASIDTTGHNWLNFMAEQADLNDLFRKGLESAVEFLTRIQDEDKHDKN